MVVILELTRVVAALLSDPGLFTWFKVSLELTIVLADDSLGWIVKPVTDVIGSFWNVFESIDVVANESLTIWSESLHLLCIESPILNSTVIPLFVLELQVIIEEVFA